MARRGSMSLGPTLFAPAPAPFDISALSCGFRPTPKEATLIAQHSCLLSQQVQDIEGLLQVWERRIVDLRAQKSKLEALAKINAALLAPIRVLPAEVLSCVFEWYTQLLWTSSSGKGPETVLRVCRLWRDVGLSTPGMWAFVSLCDERRQYRTAAVLRKYFALAGTVPLHIATSSPRHLYPTLLARPSELVLQPALERTASLDLAFSTYEEWARVCEPDVALDAPLLRDVELWTGYPERLQETGHIDAPQLRSLRVSTPSLLQLFNPSPASPLDYLSIAIPARQTEFTHDVVALAARYSPKTLHLNLNSGPELALPPSSAKSVRMLATLPHLKRLVCEDVDRRLGVVTDLLRRADCPALEELSITGSSTFALFDLLDGVPLPSLRTLRLQDCVMDEKAAKALSHYTSLEILDVSIVRVSSSIRYISPSFFTALTPETTGACVPHPHLKALSVVTDFFEDDLWTALTTFIYSRTSLASVRLYTAGLTERQLGQLETLFSSRREIRPSDGYAKPICGWVVEQYTGRKQKPTLSL